MNETATKGRLFSFIARLKESLFIRNIFVVMTGTVIAQALSFVLTPIISRLFTLSDFGIFGSFNAIAGIVGAGVTLDYSQAIMLPKERTNAFNLFAVSLLCTFLIGIICLLACILAPKVLAGLLKTDQNWPLFLLVLTTWVTGINQSCQAWAIRIKAFKYTSASQVVRSTTSSGTKIILGQFKAGANGLIISNVLANIFASISMARVLAADFRNLKTNVRWHLMRKLAKEYHDFPVYSASQNVINALSSGLPVLLLSRFFGLTFAGAYAFAENILQVPMGFILTALRQVLFQKACETDHRGQNLMALYVRTTAVLFAIALVPSLILILWGPQLFYWVFGAKWQLAGEFARSLTIWLAVAFRNLPAVLFARIIRIQRYVFFYDLILLVARSLTLVLGGFFLSASQTILLFSVVGAAMNTVLIFNVGRAVARKGGTLGTGSIRDYLGGL